MEITEEPIGYLITWTVYGTFLQGDARWWRKASVGSSQPQPKLERWHRDRLKHDIILLTPQQRSIVQNRIVEHCDHRQWKLWAVNARTNHVHVVVTASGYEGKIVRDQLKANATGALRRHDGTFTDRPVWTTKGDVEFLETNDELDQAVAYVNEAQDRMERGK